MSTTTVYFNHHAELDGISLELILELLPISEYAAGIACGEAARQRARDDVDADVPAVQAGQPLAVVPVGPAVDLGDLEFRLLPG